MCGIWGIYNFNGKPVNREVLSRMGEVLKHRGPDDDGLYIGTNRNIGLGNRRLSIIDITTKGKQPISNEDGSVWVTYNGEIYNYPALRAGLIQMGHRFRSETDTEVLVHLYEEEGIRCIEKLNGMFAFALWDERTRRMLLVRDRLGIKPLFYFLDKEKLIFASEIKAILCHPEVRREVNLRALHDFLSLNYMPAPLTMFAGISQLLPGHYLYVQGDNVEVKNYWELQFEEGEQKREKYYIEKLEEQIQRAVKYRLISDVPFGAFLSGGIDSSTIVYFMSQFLREPVETFSVGFEEPSYSELQYAKLAANHCHAAHHEIILKPKIVEEVLPKLIWHAEEPTADSSMIAIYYLSQLARERVKMCLSGDGGDELLAGYETYQAYYLGKLYRIVSKITGNFIARLVNKLPVSHRKVSFDFKAKRFVCGAELPPERAHFYWRVSFDENEKRNLYTEELREQLAHADTFETTYGGYFKETNARHPLNRMLYVDTCFYLPNDMLVKIDRMSMAHGLEVRVPFLDHELVEFLATVPPSLKLRHVIQKKYLLKKLMNGRLPRPNIFRQKQGFNLPKGIWMKETLRDMCLDILSPNKVRELPYFKPEVVNKILHDHFGDKKDNSHQVWGLLVFFLWWEKFIKRRPGL